MSAQMFVILNVFDNHIQNSATDLQVSFEKCNEVFAVIGKYPHTVLESREADLLHSVAQSVAYDPAAFRDVKNNYAPAPVPSALLQ